MEISAKKINCGIYVIEVINDKGYYPKISNLLVSYNLDFTKFCEYLNSNFTVKWINNELYLFSLEDAQKVSEYLESLIVMAKLCNDECFGIRRGKIYNL